MSSRKNKPVSLPGRIAGSIFFFVFLAAGLFFTFIIFTQVMKAESARNWPSVHGTLTRAEIKVDENSNEPFTVTGDYAYTVLGRNYSSSRVKLETPEFASYRKAHRLMTEVLSANPLKVYYNPDNPEEAVLTHGSRWGMFLILFPMIFVLIGLGGIIAMWVKGRPSSKSTSISQKATKNKGGRWVFAIFFLAGAGFMAVFLLPAKSTMEAKGWPEVPCEILYSKLRSYQSDDGTTYKADILFSYTINGNEYRSNQVQFMGGSSSGRESKRKILRQYPKGSSRVCYVDPKDPTRAVLLKGFTPIYFFALIPLLFMVIGGAGITHGFKKSLASDGKTSFRQPTWDVEEQVDAEETILKAGQPRWMGFAFLLFFAVFWNGAVFGLLVPDVIDGLKRGSGIFLTVFSLPFILVGIGVAVGCVVMLLKQFNPRAEITIKPGTVRPGETINLNWKLSGGIKPLEELTLTLYGQERATYRRGTNTYHDKNRFAETILYQSDQTLDFKQGETRHALPHTAMPTFDGGNNKIQWFVEVKGVIRQWPDLKMQYELILSPVEPIS